MADKTRVNATCIRHLPTTDEKPAGNDAATPPGSNSNYDVTGDVAALQHRQNLFFEQVFCLKRNLCDAEIAKLCCGTDEKMPFSADAIVGGMGNLSD